MAPAIIISIQAALDHLLSCTNKYGIEDDDIKKLQDLVVYKLRCVNTFVICSTKLCNDVQLTSLWERLDNVVCRILDDEFSSDSTDNDAERFFENMDPFVEELDKWFTDLPDYDLQQSAHLPVAVRGQVADEILGSVVENFKDFLMAFDESIEVRKHLIQPITTLKEYMAFLRNFICFATLLCGDQHQEVQNLFTKIEALAFSAAHLTVYIFASEDHIDRMNSINSSLQLMIKPFHNPQLCEAFSQTLVSLKYSRELYAPTLNDRINIVLMDLISYLIFLLWDILKSEVASMILPLQPQLEALYDGLRFLRTLPRKLPNMFHAEIRDSTRVAICNAGVIIFSIYQKDFVIDHELQDFLGNIKVIQSEFDEKKLSFSGTTLLAFLDSLLDYMNIVNSSKVHSSVISCVPKIREDIAFLISFMGILMELKEPPEELHVGLWNLVVEVAYKLEFLVDQLVLGHILGSFSPPFLSIAADMRIIKTDALKIFDDKRLDKVRDIKMAARIIISIQPVLDHLQFCMNRNGSETLRSQEMKAVVTLTYRLRCLRTFVICSTNLGINVELRSLWIRLDEFVRRILNDNFSRHSAGNITEKFLDNMDSYVEEMDRWFIVFSDYCLHQSNLAAEVTSQVLDDLIGSVVENFKDFLSRLEKDQNERQRIEYLKNYMVFLRNFIRLTTHLCGDQHQEVEDLLSQIQGLAVGAAHLTLYMFAAGDTNNRMNSINSALLLKIKPYHNPKLYETCSRALASLKYSRDQLYAPISLQDPLIFMMDFIGYLLSHFMDMGEPDVGFVNPSHEPQLKTLCDGLNSITTCFNKLPSMFHGEIRDITKVAVCDAGVIMFSLHLKDFVMDHGLKNVLGNIEVIQSEFEAKKLLVFPNSTVLGFLDSILDKSAKVHPNAQKLEPKIQLDLVFLRYLMVKLVELRKKQEDLHQPLWILAVKVAYKFELLVDILVEDGAFLNLRTLAMSFLSIAEDMNMIKTDSFKIFHHKPIEEVGDIETASQRILSIHSALDHLQSFLCLDDFEYGGPKERIMLVMNRLRCLRTFVLCSTKLGNNVQLMTLLAKLDYVIHEIMDCKFNWFINSISDWFTDSMEPFEEEIDKWFIRLSYYNLQQCSSSPMATRVKDILDSLFENLEDFKSFPKSEEFGDFDDQVDVLKETTTFLTNFINFASHMCADQHQEVRDIFTQIESFAVNAAHLTLLYYAHPKYIYEYRMESVISVLELSIRPFQNLHFCAPTLHTKGDPLTAMMDSIDSQLSLLWNMLLSDVTLVVLSRSQLEKLDSGLRFLKALLRKQSNKFDDDTMDMARLAICNAGLIFSLDQKDFVIGHGLQQFQVILKKVEEKVVPTSTLNFPRTIMLGFLDFLVEYMTEVESSKFDSNTLNSVSNIPEDLAFLKLLMGKLVELRDQHEDLHQALWNLCAATAYKIEFLIDQLVLGDIADSFSASVQSITEDMVIIRNDSVEVLNMNVQKITWASIDQVPSQSSTPAFNDFVGLKPEQISIVNRLRRGSKKLQVVAILGMPGLGKTTLATKVYHEPSVVDYFNVRAWCSISQVFNQRKILLELLHHIQKKPPTEYGEKTVDDLAEEFCRSLKGRRYLIFLDDVWDIKVYNWLQVALPENSTGSRIILTTRLGDVATLDNEPVLLSLFTPKESFELLRGKVFPDRKDWPPELHELGIQIAESCKGLPLTIVIVAGLLTTSKQDYWNHVLQSLRSGIISNTDQCESTIELSYNFLPDHLKRCFLSFAAFPEDHEISVKRLIWMWIAEGFVQKSESKSLEEVAKDCLKNLIGRSLLMNVKESSTGGVKACRIHDLLRDFCLKKATEEFYIHQLDGNGEVLSFDDPGKMRRLCILSKPRHLKKFKMYWPRLRSLLFFGTNGDQYGYDMSFIFRIFKLLRVLDMERVDLSFKSPSEIGFLVQLRYLAIQVDSNSEVNPSIGYLSNLETFILAVTGGRRVRLPGTFWNLQKLIHLYMNSGDIVELPVDNLQSTSNLVYLGTFSTLLCEDWDVMEKKLRKFPNISRLKCQFSGNWIYSQCVSFSFLMYLESLSLSLDANPTHEYELAFPKTIKKLTLHDCGWPWRKVSGIAGLPNLEVLKLLSWSFVGDMWHVEEGEFPKLRVLKLSCLYDIVNWTSSDDQFRNLEKLVLHNCPKLEEIPECLETVDTLELIEVFDCSDCITRSVKSIEEYQKDMGNSVLRVEC